MSSRVVVRILSGLMACWLMAGVSAEEPKSIFSDDPDFEIQGEYLGELTVNGAK